MHLDNTEEIIKNVLSLMNVKFDSVERIDDSLSKHFKFLVKTPDSSALIGPNGTHLEALNYLIRRIVNKKNDEENSVKFVIDVNGYHDKALESLRAKARVMADRARSFKVNVELEPMSSYERMVVHSCLQESPEIKTESIGDGPNRKVVIKYVGKTPDQDKI